MLPPKSAMLYVFASLLFSALALQPPTITKVISSNDIKYADQVSVGIEPQEYTPDSLFVRVTNDYQKEVWPKAPLSNFSASWALKANEEPHVILFGNHYSFTASFDGENWGPDFSFRCCERERPANQGTVVLSGNITTSVTEKNDKLRIADSAILFPGVKVQGWWEVEFEHNVTFLVSPADVFPLERSISGVWNYPINLTGIHVNFLFDQNFHGAALYHPDQVQVCTFSPIVGEISLPVSPIGNSPLCQYNGAFLRSNTEINANFTCPACSVKPYDYLYLPFALFVLCFAIIFALSRRGNYSAWKLVNMGFAMVMASVVVVAGILALALFVNGKRSEDDPFCDANRIKARADDGMIHGLPISAALTCIALGIVWFNVVAFNFPRESSKSGERFCAGSSPSQRVHWYFGLWILLVIIFGLTLWTPLWFLWFSDDGWTKNLVVTVAIVPPLAAAVIILTISWICLTTCCRNEKFDRYFAESSGEYMTIQASGF